MQGWTVTGVTRLRGSMAHWIVLTFLAAQDIGSHCVLLCGNDGRSGFAVFPAKPLLGGG